MNRDLAAYVEKAAGTESTAKANLDAFAKYQIVPRVLRGVESPDLGVKILDNTHISLPVMIGPTAFHKMFHADGERAVQQATRDFGIVNVISSFSTSTFQEIGRLGKSGWYQLLMYKDKDLMQKYILEAEQAGCSALVLTVDAPLGCTMCKRQTGPSLEFPIQHMPLLPKDPNRPYQNLDEYYATYIKTNASWHDISKIIDSTALPVIVKGVLHADDVQEAADIGAQGVIISNHGGRQLDGAIASLDSLTQIPHELRNYIDIYMDGGIRRGTDVFKALALGAKAVLIGRPVLYALSEGGSAGVKSLLKSIRDELSNAMHLSGCSRIEDITRDLVYKRESQ